MKLVDMQKGQRGRIQSIDSRSLELALLKLGLLRGDHFEVSNTAPFQGPLALQVDGTKIALRRTDAVHITVEPLP